MRRRTFSRRASDDPMVTCRRSDKESLVCVGSTLSNRPLQAWHQVPAERTDRLRDARVHAAGAGSLAFDVAPPVSRRQLDLPSDTRLVLFAEVAGFHPALHNVAVGRAWTPAVACACPSRHRSFGAGNAPFSSDVLCQISNAGQSRTSLSNKQEGTRWTQCTSRAVPVTPISFHRVRNAICTRNRRRLAFAGKRSRLKPLLRSPCRKAAAVHGKGSDAAGAAALPRNPAPSLTSASLHPRSRSRPVTYHAWALMRRGPRTRSRKRTGNRYGPTRR
jgi:hypothetical protein